MSPQNSHSSLLWIRWHLIFLFCNRFYWSLVPTLKSGQVICQAYHHAQSNWPMNMRCQMINQLQKSGCEMLLCSNVRDLVISDSALHTWKQTRAALCGVLPLCCFCHSQLLNFLSPHLFVAVHQLEHISSIAGKIAVIRHRSLEVREMQFDSAIFISDYSL